MTTPTFRRAFSTLGCPDWSFERVLAEAQQDGYEGIELRVLDGQLVDLSLPPEERKRVKRLAGEAGIAIACVDSSIKLASGGDPASVAEELIGHMELAREWNSELVRVFPGAWPAGHDQEQVIAAMAEIVERALPAAERLGVAIVLETHDTFSRATLVAELLRTVPNRWFGVIWDVYQPHISGETPEQVFAALDDRILHVHIKDARRVPDEPDHWELTPLGAGEVPVRDILSGLRARGYSGWLSVEWPNYWQRDLAGPEIVLPQHAAMLRAWLEQLDQQPAEPVTNTTRTERIHE
jgi:sugar phosphate isomerase/epimerase